MVDSKINIQENLNRLKEIRKQIYNNSKDQGTMIYNKVEYLGKLPSTEREVYRVIEKYSVDNLTEVREFIYEHKDDEFKMIGVRNKDTFGKIIPTSEYIYENNEIQFIEKVIEERQKELEIIAKELGISEEEINNLDEIDLEQKIENKEKENQEEKEREPNENKSQKISEEKMKNSGQIGLNEVDLNTRVDGKGTRLKDVLKLDGYTKIIVVHSYRLTELTNSEGERGKKTIEKYALIAQKSDGSYETFPQLEPDRGENKKIIEINNKDDVETKRVDNRFKVPGSDNSLVVDPKDPYNIPNIYLSRNTPDNDGQLAQRLQDKYDGTEQTDVEVRAVFNANRGEYMTKEAVKEARKHPEDCEKGVEEVDGDEYTGHVDFDPQDPEQQNAIKEIMERGNVSEEEATRLFATHLKARDNQEEGQERRIKYAKEEAISEIENQYRGRDKREQ